MSDHMQLPRIKGPWPNLEAMKQTILDVQPMTNFGPKWASALKRPFVQLEFFSEVRSASSDDALIAMYLAAAPWNKGIKNT